MDNKRKLRIVGFVVFNLLLISSPLIYSVIMLNFFDDDCGPCYLIERSTSLPEAREKGTLLNSYKIIKSDFENNSSLRETIPKIQFWKERVKITSPTSGNSFDDTLLMWSDLNNEDLEFKISDNKKFKDAKESFGFWSAENNFKDTIIIGVFKEEEVNQGNFIYVKKPDFNK